MKKIGILTFFGVPNYGAWAQAFALNNVVRELVKDEVLVEHIDYLNQTHYDLYYKSDMKLFNNFRYSWNCIPHSKRMTCAKDLEETEYDVIITGSDSIWEFSLPEMGNDEHLIGNNLSASTIISYAASAGVTELESIKDIKLLAGLNKYNSISVRDNFTADSVEHIIGIRPNVVLDPVFIWQGDEKYIIHPEYDNYIAVYGVEWTDEFIYFARKFARENGKKLISIGWINPWCDVSFRMNELRTLEWMGMLKDADYVFTSTFHGLMFSLKYEKQVKFCLVDYVKNRAETLLGLCGNLFELYNKDNIGYKDIFNNSIDYSIVTSNIEAQRKKSLNYLEKALDGYTKNTEFKK